MVSIIVNVPIGKLVRDQMIHIYSMVLCLAVAEPKRTYCHHRISCLSVEWYWSNMNQQPMYENIESDIFSE